MPSTSVNSFIPTHNNEKLLREAVETASPKNCLDQKMLFAYLLRLHRPRTAL